MPRVSRVISFSALLVALLPLHSQSTGAKSEGEILFRVGSSSFNEGRPRTRVEIQYDVPYDQLNFLKTDTAYTASFDISVVFYDLSGDQVGGDVWRRHVVSETYEETKSVTRRYGSYVEFRIIPGSYRMKVMLEDLSSGRTGTVIEDLKVRSFGERKLELSDPVFLRFFSDSLSLPNPSREYYWGPRAAVRFSVYKASSGDSLSLQTSLIDSEGETWSTGPIFLSDEFEQTKTIVFSVDTLPEDTFSFVVSLAGSVLADWSFVVHQPFFGSDEEYTQRIEAMEYIATGQELKELKGAAPEDRASVYSDFWKDRDPVPSTDINEAEIEYFSRVEYANRHFGGLEVGWRTDRGRVYIQYGRPDEIDKHPFEIDSAPYEIWYYYGTGRRFLFVDEHNLGRYELKSWTGR